MKVKIKHVIEADNDELAAFVTQVVAASKIVYSTSEEEINAMNDVIKPVLDALVESAFELGKKMATADTSDDTMDQE